MLGMALIANREAAGVESVTLFDRNPGAVAESLARGAGDVGGPSLDGAFRTDTVVLATPVDQIVSLLDEFGPRVPDRSLVIDTGGAKGVTVAAMRRSVRTGAHAVGGHPMAGTERPGPAGADPDRLRGATFVLTPVREDPAGMERARAFVHAVGARSLEMDAGDHDRAVALTSHLPHLLAFALASTVVPSEGADALLARLVSTGFLGASRLAESDPATTASFLSANARGVEEAAKMFASSFDALVALVDDRAGLQDALESARERRRALTGEAGS